MEERQTAFLILNRMERAHAYSNLALDAELRQSGAQGTAAGFVTALVYGVTERKITLDWILSSFLAKPLKKLQPEVLTALRMGVYQLKFMDKVPVSAAVNESVKLVRANRCAYAAGLVNSVLRNAALQDVVYPDKSDLETYLHIRYSCPRDLVRHYIHDYGETDAEGILKESIGAVSTTIRVNTLKTTADALRESLASEGIQTDASALAHTLLLRKFGAVENLESYRRGLFHVQDLASALCVQALDVRPGQTLMDVCAAPGGKSFTAAEEMENRGRILAFDLHAHRVKLIEDGAKRLGISVIEAKQADASELQTELVGIADRVLCDVPCSGLGVIRRKPEIRYKDPASFDNLPDLQYNILSVASAYLKRDGKLVYSTCTLNRAENDAVCDRFLETHPNFLKTQPYKTLLPHKDGTDGFFIACFGRK